MARERKQSLLVVDSLKVEIAEGAIPEGALLPTERELQERFSVSRSTVRRALANLVEQGWALNHANRGVLARVGLSVPRSSLIAFIDDADSIHKSLFFYLAQILAGQGFHLVHIDSTHRKTIGALEHVAEGGFAAAVFWGKEVWIDPCRFEAVRDRLPLVAVDHLPYGLTADVVMGDHFDGARQAVSHLLRLGRERVAISGFLTFLDDSHERLHGYVKAFFDHGVDVQAHDLLFSAPVTGAYDHPRLLEQRLRDADRPDAVFVLHDISAPAIASSILDCGLRIPEDVALVGFGNDLPFTLENVGLTTVAVDWRGIAQAISDRVCSRIAYPRAPFERTVLPAHLIVRGSCGAPASTWSDEEYQVSSATLTRRMSPTAWRPEFSGGGRAMVPRSLSLPDTNR